MKDVLLEKSLLGKWQYLQGAENSIGPVTGTVEFKSNGQFTIAIRRKTLSYADVMGKYEVQNGILSYSRLEEVDSGPALSPYFTVQKDVLYFWAGKPDPKTPIGQSVPAYKLQRIRDRLPKSLTLPELIARSSEIVVGHKVKPDSVLPYQEGDQFFIADEILYGGQMELGGLLIVSQPGRDFSYQAFQPAGAMSHQGILFLTRDPRNRPYFQFVCENALESVKQKNVILAELKTNLLSRLASPQQAYEALLRAMEQGDTAGLQKICTPAGSRSLLRMQGDQDVAEFFRRLGKEWARAKINWSEEGKTADRVAGSLFDGTKSTPYLYFVRTAVGWKLDDFVPGK